VIYIRERRDEAGGCGGRVTPSMVASMARQMAARWSTKTSALWSILLQNYFRSIETQD
jgi:hypothetical protein